MIFLNQEASCIAMFSSQSTTDDDDHVQPATSRELHCIDQDVKCDPTKTKTGQSSKEGTSMNFIMNL
jgi:hypothetical protein